MEEPKTIYLKDYTPPHYLVDHLELTFKIFQDKTIVTALSSFRRNTKEKAPLILQGEHLKVLSVTLDGQIASYEFNGKELYIETVPDHFTLQVDTEIDPASNTALEGLYQSGGGFCTQCEAEGFRRITCFPDRPDVMTVFTVRIEADKKTGPVLLSNGNLVEVGDLPFERHFAVWHDPFPKPCYLFALVAGDLVYIQDFFNTRSGLKVDLRIYVREGDQNQCAHAMKSLIQSMKWDEEVYGREYQLERFNIVAVSDFNMGAMENTSLNIFNTALVLAHPDLATDADFKRVESVIAHEYFHNWSGNRVTCRDWFQLSLKEGFTVFREQEFSADMNSEGVQRIEEVDFLKSVQFKEDAGPLAHPVRPDNYMKINNFYTVTVYEKGAELIRMLHILLGKKLYRKATDLYFSKYDGMAVTCDDFIRSMEEVSRKDLSQFKLWYSKAGTPEVEETHFYDAKEKTYTLKFLQNTEEPFHIPVLMGLLNAKGEEIEEKLLELREKEEEFVFKNIEEKPVPSLLRSFSAPVKLKTALSNEELGFLMIHDQDLFNRWEALQTLSLKMSCFLLENPSEEVWPVFLTGFGKMIEQAFLPGADKAFLARCLIVPDVSRIGQERKIVDPAAIYAVYLRILSAIREKFAPDLRALYTENREETFSCSFEGRAKRFLTRAILSLLQDTSLAKAHYDQACCMTDRVSALEVLSGSEGIEREEAFDDFYARFKNHKLVVDKWFSIQAMAIIPKKTLARVKSLRSHPDFSLKNPNRARSLLASFAHRNPVCFHDPSGEGYLFLGEAIKELDPINPQIASRLLTPFKEWRSYTPDLQEKMKKNLCEIREVPGISADVFEIVSKCLL